MRTSRSAGSSERPFFSEEEIDRIAIDELRAADLLPSAPGPIRIERFVEKRFRLAGVRYESLPPGVLGYTQFGSHGVEAVIVVRQLSEEGSQSADRRISTTLAHEAGHGLLHAHLFTLEQFPTSLFEGTPDVSPTKILCRDEAARAPSRSYDGRWWEFQANRMIGALLLPRDLARAAVQDLLVPTGTLGLPVLPAERRIAATRLFSDVFDVNPAAAEIRVQQLFGAAERSQLTL